MFFQNLTALYGNLFQHSFGNAGSIRAWHSAFNQYRINNAAMDKFIQHCIRENIPLNKISLPYAVHAMRPSREPAHVPLLPRLPGAKNLKTGRRYLTMLKAQLGVGA